MSSGKSNPLARIPGVDTILGTDEAAPLIAKYGHTKLVQCIRDQLAIIRAGLQRTPDSPIHTASDLLVEVENTLTNLNQGSLQTKGLNAILTITKTTTPTIAIVLYCLAR